MTILQVKIDTSEVEKACSRLADALSANSMNAIIKQAVRDTAKHATPVISAEVRKQYKVHASWVKGAIGRYRMEGTTAYIPIKGVRAVIGGPEAPTSGKPWKSSKKSAKAAAKIRFQILKAKKSLLPPTLQHQGGNSPFFNTGILHRNGNPYIFTRRTDKRLPIVKVSSLSVPTMVTSRSMEPTRINLSDYLLRRVNHYLDLKIK